MNHTALLLAIAEGANDPETAYLMGRTVKSVRFARRLFGLLKTPRGFTPSEEQMLIDLYPHVATSDLARLLDRAETSICRRAQNLGLAKTPQRLIEASHTHRLLPPEVQELLALNQKIKRKLREKHR